jgi:hypothetical protein
MARGWCRKHYLRWYKHGTTDDPAKAQKPPCSVDDCNRESGTRGWCSMHYQRWRATGTTGLRKHSGVPRVQPSCAVDGCGKASVARGWCGAHYMRWSKHGDPALSGYGHLLRTPVEDRFWPHVDKGTPDECWPWNAGVDLSGYGRIWAATESGKPDGSHRVSWRIHNGPIPAGLFVCHRCDNPPCCNPGHLFLGTNEANMADMVRKGRARSLKGSENRSAKLHESQVRDIRRRYIKGDRFCGQVGLAAEYGVSGTAIADVVHGRTWKAA